MQAHARFHVTVIVLLSAVIATCSNGGPGESSNGSGGVPPASGGAAANGGTPGSGGVFPASAGGSLGTGSPAGGVMGGGGVSARGGRSGTPTGGSQGTGGVGTAGSTGACTPDYACRPTSPDTGDPYADCVARVNQYRACVCLPPLPRWTDGEACANDDAKYDSEQNTAHAGFSAQICKAGNAQDECPNWGGTYASVISGCLQMMFDEGPPETSTCTGTCYQDHGHYINMTGTKYKSGVACGFYTMANGKIWAVQNFQ
jgi:hypothetical protein